MKKKTSYTLFNYILLASCKCTSEYNKELSGVPVEAFCGEWDADGKWCYLTGGLNARNCPGAHKSGGGDFYWTKDAEICRAAEKNKQIGKGNTIYTSLDI